jgi:UDP-galactopyranose mutase
MKVDTQKIVKHLINKMFEYAYVPQTYDDIIHRKDEWYQEHTMTQEQSDAFKDYAIRYLKRELKSSYYKADTEYQWFDLMWGLKISDVDKNDTFEDLEE